MYTQCPDCESAFRVTARVLQQAAGQVRCSGCGHHFNALDRLTEGPPAADDSLSGDPENRALLESLDEFSGPENIRIEDTGVEWRVLDEDLDVDSIEAIDAESEDPGDSGGTASAGWYMEEEEEEDNTLDRDAQASLDLATAPGDADEERYDDNTPLADSLDDDEQSVPPEPPRRRAEDQLEPRSPEFDERQVDLALSEAGDWTDLLDEVGSGTDAAAPADDDLADTDIRDLGADFEEAGTGDDDLPCDIDTQFDLQALEMGLDATGSFEAASEEPTVDSGPENGPDKAIGDAAEEISDDAADPMPASDDQTPPADTAAADDIPELEHHVPPQSEEEMTINRLIDQDLLRFTVEESTLRETTPGDRMPRNEPPHVETIIMEGEYVHRSLDGELPPVEIDNAGSKGKTGGFKDTWITNKERLHDGPQRMDAKGRGLIAATAVLALLMVAQVVHAYRESLATHDAFDRTVGSIYRFFGAPVTPDWNVKGWQVETSSGNTDASDRVLTISSRIANTSQQSLPYPLLHVSLTDRWQEIIGSRVLEPDEYLSGNVDHAGNASPGEKFNAVITIAPLSPDATGFKLNVCYRLDGMQLRCANGAFKN